MHICVHLILSVLFASFVVYNVEEFRVIEWKNLFNTFIILFLLLTIFNSLLFIIELVFDYLFSKIKKSQNNDNIV
jgi:uncharacterized membrane protein YadS